VISADVGYEDGGWMFARPALHGCSSRTAVELTNVDAAMQMEVSAPINYVAVGRKMA
jgi:hypothetical protein